MISTSHSVLVLVFLHVMLVSCSDDNSGSGQTSGTGGGASQGGASQGGASQGGASGNSSSVASSQNIGEYTLIWGPSAGYRGGNVDANFLLAADVPKNCHRTTIGDCYSEACEPNSNAALPDAGTITLTDVQNSTSFDLDPWSRGAYSDKGLSFSQMFPLGDPSFTSGESLRVHTDGGRDVPAFSVDLVFPTRAATRAQEAQSASQDASFTWVAGKAGETMVFDSFGGVICSAPVERGSLTIPRTFLTVNDEFRAFTQTTGVANAGTWTITARVATPVTVASSGLLYTLKITE